MAPKTVRIGSLTRGATRSEGERDESGGPGAGRRPQGVQAPILPPPCLVMATTDGRTGMSSLEVGPAGRGVLVVGRPAEAFPVVAAVARMLDRDEDGLVVGREQRAAELGADRHAEEQLRGGARLALGVDRPEAVGAAGGLAGCCRRSRPRAGRRRRWRSCRACRTSRSRWSRSRRWRRPRRPRDRRTSAGSSQVPVVAAKSPPSSAISMMWPKAFSARGLAASTCSALRLVLLVSIT